MMKKKTQLLHKTITFSTKSCVNVIEGCGTCIIGTEDSKNNCSNTNIVDRIKSTSKRQLDNDQRPIIYLNTMNHLMGIENRNKNLAKTIWESFPVFRGTKDDADFFAKAYIPYKPNLFCCFAETCFCCCFNVTHPTPPKSWNGLEWSGQARKVGKHWKTVMFILALMIVSILSWKRILPLFQDLLPELTDWVPDHIVEGSILYMTAVILANSMLIPVTLLEIIGSFLLGPFRGFTLSVIGKLISSVLCFYIGRIFLPKKAKEIAQDNHALCVVGHIICDNQWKMIPLIRLMFIHSLLTSLALGTLKITFACFFWCSLMASIPYSILWAMVGFFSKTVLAVLSGKFRKSAAHIALGIGGISIVIFAILLYVLNRRIMEERKIILDSADLPEYDRIEIKTNKIKN